MSYTYTMSRLCQLCKRQKKKCDGQSPCSRCHSLGVPCKGPDLFVNCGTADSVVKGRAGAGSRARAPRRKKLEDTPTEPKAGRLQAKKEACNPDTPQTQNGHIDSDREHETLHTDKDIANVEDYALSRRGSYASTVDSVESISTFNLRVTIEAVALAKHFAPVQLHNQEEVAITQPMANVFARHFSRASMGSPLKSATEAVALLLFSQSTAQDAGRVLASEVHVTALRAVQFQLNNLPKDEQQLRELMLAIMALGQYEGFSSSANGRQVYNKHIDGLAQLITIVCKRNPDCYVALRDVLDSLIPTIRFNHCFRAVPQDKYHFPECERQGDEPHDMMAEISRGLGPLTALRSEAARLNTLDPLNRQLQGIRTVLGLLDAEKERRKWLSALPEDFRTPTRIRRLAMTPSPHEVHLWPREAHIYRTPLAALLIILSYICRLLILHALRQCYDFGSTTNPDADFFPDHDMIEDYSQAVTEEMCAATFSLVHRRTLDPADDTAELSSPVIHMNSAWRVISAMMTALDYGCLEPRQRHWVQSAISNIRNAQSPQSP